MSTPTSTTPPASTTTTTLPTIDYGTPLGLVRLIIADHDPTRLLLKDPAVLGFLRMEGVSADAAAAQDPTAEHLRACRLAAANALDSIASSTVQVAQVIRTQDLQTDGAKAAAALQAQAKALRAQVEAADQREVAELTSSSSVLEFGDY